MEGINRAIEDESVNKAFRNLLESIDDKDVPCIFICYQRRDEEYASEVAEYIKSKQLDVYFDLEDNDLKQINQTANPAEVTDAIKKGLNQSDYMIVIVSPSTATSPWVPFEVGYAYDKKGDKLKILRHKGILKNTMPAYLKVKELLNGTVSLNRFLGSIRKRNVLYEKLEKGGKLKTFSVYTSNPLNKYLDNE
jgi:nucleoside 2-deoxyribosyltransferase